MSGQTGDREQIRRAAEMVVFGSDEGDIQYLAAHCLALLDDFDKVPALVEALRYCARRGAADSATAQAALAEWENTA